MAQQPSYAGAMSLCLPRKTAPTIRPSVRLFLALYAILTLAARTEGQSQRTTLPHVQLQNTSNVGVTIPLSGGVMHPAGFYFDAEIGGQNVKLQLDSSYASIIVPHSKCVGCRLGIGVTTPRRANAPTWSCAPTNAANGASAQLSADVANAPMPARAAARTGTGARSTCGTPTRAPATAPFTKMC